MAKNAVVQAEPDTQKGTGSFPIKVLRFILWAALITGIVAAILNPILALIWPDRAGLNLPIGILQSRNFRSEISSKILAITCQNRVAPLFEYTNRQYNIPFAQLPSIDRFILLIGQSLLALVWSYGAWLLLGILQNLPKPFIWVNTQRLMHLG